MLDGKLEAGVVEKDMAVAPGDALEGIWTTTFVPFGSRGDAVSYDRRSSLIVIVVIAITIAIFRDAGVPSGLTMK